jgi:hypothetical protein
MAALNGAIQATVESLQTQFLEVKLECKEYHHTANQLMQVLIRNRNLILQVLNFLATTLGNGNNGVPSQPPHQADTALPPPPAQQPTNLHGAHEEGKDDEDDVAPPLEDLKRMVMKPPNNKLILLLPATAAAIAAHVAPPVDPCVRSNQ